MDPVSTTATEKDPYGFYFARLDGADVQPEARAPECGFYRYRHRNRWNAVAIFHDRQDNGFRAIEHDGRGGPWVIRDDLEEIIELFGLCWDKPVNEDIWRAVVEHGSHWPDEPPAEKPPTNLSADPLEEILYQLRGEEEELQRFLEAPIDTQEKADRAGNWAVRIDELGKKADELRKQEKRPHDEAAQRVQARWRPVCELADSLKRRVKQALTGWLREKERRLTEERAAAIHAMHPVPPAKNPKAGTVGRPVALTTLKTAEIDDYLALATFLLEQGNVDLRDTLQTIANKLARAGANAPGMRIVTVTRAR